MTPRTIEELFEALPAGYYPEHKSKCANKNAPSDIGAIYCHNGIIQYKVFCTSCFGKGGALPYSMLVQIDTKDVPVLKPLKPVPCERCGSEHGSEMHHWAPRYLFDDADDWPTSMLCKSCHLLWHRKVTPAMAANENRNTGKAA